ncbi:MAG: hypothetical protein IPM01_30565 [Burkholderiaceae bacterium]|nr:hypothetical protein [Burkholderiaceae bacterium]
MREQVRPTGGRFSRRYSIGQSTTSWCGVAEMAQQLVVCRQAAAGFDASDGPATRATASQDQLHVARIAALEGDQGLRAMHWHA